jgi:entericidin B
MPAVWQRLVNGWLSVFLASSFRLASVFLPSSLWLAGGHLPIRPFAAVAAGTHRRAGCSLDATIQRTAPMTRALALLSLLVLAACETVEGAGRDIESAGEAITEESQEVQAGT